MPGGPRGDFDPANLRVFRNRYPESPLVVVAADVDRSFEKRYGDLDVAFRSLPDLVREVASRPVDP